MHQIGGFGLASFPSFMLKLSSLKCDWRMYDVFVVCRPLSPSSTLDMWESLDFLDSIIDVSLILCRDRRLRL